MTNSMTAFAQVSGDNISWEIRSVNQRYLDVTFRMPESLRILEASLRSMTKAIVSRGKIDCTLRLTNDDAHPALTLDEGLLATITNLQEEIAAKSGTTPTKNALDLLRWPGVIKEPEQDVNSQCETAKALFADAMRSLVSMRAKEGCELQRIIEEKLHELATRVSEIRNATPKILANHQQKVRDKLAELSSEADPARLEQELVLIANKSDIAEELDRLDTHISEIRNTLTLSESIGRRLDFLMQELNRETNTLSSKALHTDTTLSTVDMKVLIEQMREQIQNIE